MTDFNKALKYFHDTLDALLEYDENIEVDSVNELVEKATKYMEE